MPIPSFTTPPGESTAPPLELLDLAAKHIIVRSVAVAAKLRLADHLADGPRSAEELAGLCGAHPRSLYRMLRLLATAGIFTKTGDDRFALTPLGDCLWATTPCRWVRSFGWWTAGRSPSCAAAGSGSSGSSRRSAPSRVEAVPV